MCTISMWYNVLYHQLVPISVNVHTINVFLEQRLQKLVTDIKRLCFYNNYNLTIIFETNSVVWYLAFSSRVEQIVGSIPCRVKPICYNDGICWFYVKIVHQWVRLDWFAGIKINVSELKDMSTCGLLSEWANAIIILFDVSVWYKVADRIIIIHVSPKTSLISSWYSCRFLNWH